MAGGAGFNTFHPSTSPRMSSIRTRNRVNFTPTRDSSTALKPPGLIRFSLTQVALDRGFDLESAVPALQRLFLGLTSGGSKEAPPPSSSTPPGPFPNKEDEPLNQGDTSPWYVLPEKVREALNANGKEASDLLLEDPSAHNGLGPEFSNWKADKDASSARTLLA
jgi:hypothetical protein